MKLQLEVVIGLIVAVVLAVALSLGANHYMSLREAAAQNEQRGQVLQTTSGIIKDADTTATQRQQEQAQVATGRIDFHATIEEAKRNEPETADRATRTVPASVRNAYRERRLARERLGRASERSEARAGTENAPER